MKFWNRSRQYKYSKTFIKRPPFGQKKISFNTGMVSLLSWNIGCGPKNEVFLILRCSLSEVLLYKYEEYVHKESVVPYQK